MTVDDLLELVIIINCCIQSVYHSVLRTITESR